mmetsp:Transcript_16611/g.20700  ORF Transcript_16611/g.20700 Transcript_16611/m.20700 type:complete len:146 (+) Transcript_16611:50-487(+)|eukprot:CAMPEP_0172511622 /NCGR_PEP_ID=MMETSP1066-20121228/237800_1 /TAXON_ID=671091 /ORGANISM="Coscinodiscus wailesii, Strain CCMP2513" /LENGTH=145 /DNA_ID=CAMNT_0013291073 /DNA_START=50 /DNA_END=487 /DNA_ORIENTATION=-
MTQRLRSLLLGAAALLTLFASQAAALSLGQRVQSMVNTHKVLMFMNGSQISPKCAKSSDAVLCLERICGAGAPDKNGRPRDENLFRIVDVTSSKKICEGLREFNPEWDPSIPQLYVGGEFFGGVDTMYKKFYSGNLKKVIDAIDE